MTTPTQQHYQARRIEAGAKAAYCWTHPSSSWDNVKESIKSLYLEESKAALAAVDSVQCSRSNGLNPDMPMQELLLHMGELTAAEIRTARAAIRWANSQCAKGCGDGYVIEVRGGKTLDEAIAAVENEKEPTNENWMKFCTALPVLVRAAKSYRAVLDKISACYLMLPIEPTDEMLTATNQISSCDRGGYGEHAIGKGVALEVWQAMIAAHRTQKGD